jgi:ankyrin repeat protein
VNKDSYGFYTPLSVATQNVHLEVVQALVAAGADVNKANIIGASSLITWATDNGHTDIAAALQKAPEK